MFPLIEDWIVLTAAEIAAPVAAKAVEAMAFGLGSVDDALSDAGSETASAENATGAKPGADAAAALTSGDATPPLTGSGIADASGRVAGHSTPSSVCTQPAQTSKELRMLSRWPNRSTTWILPPSVKLSGIKNFKS